MSRYIDIKEYDYLLEQQRIARYPLDQRDASRLLLYRGGEITHDRFGSLARHLMGGALLVFNNTKVIRARLDFYKESGARIEIFCLEPEEPAGYENALAARGGCRWRCMIGNARKWKDGAISAVYTEKSLPFKIEAFRLPADEGDAIVEFRWDGQFTFGQVLETLGRIPIPPYLNRKEDETDQQRYQTVYSKHEGSVAAPTAGLHFTETVFSDLRSKGIDTREITLHVGAGTFLPVKSENAALHAMHTEHFELTSDTLAALLNNPPSVVAVGTTSVRTLESLTVLGHRILQSGSPQLQQPVGQWEAYDIAPQMTGQQLLTALAEWMKKEHIDRLQASTQIMIVPGYRFRVVQQLITNFHQPKSTLLLLISAFVGEDWKTIYHYALDNGFRFLSYGDSSLLCRSDNL